MPSKKIMEQLAEAHCDTAIQNDLVLIARGFTHRDIAELWMAHALAHSTRAGMSTQDAMLMFARICGEIQAHTKAGAS